MNKHYGNKILFPHYNIIISYLDMKTTTAIAF